MYLKTKEFLKTKKLSGLWCCFLEILLLCLYIGIFISGKSRNKDNYLNKKYKIF